MEKWIIILSVLFIVIAGIDAQGGGRFQRLMFLRQRQLALRRAFPFGVPITMRGGFFPSRFSTRFPFTTAQRGSARFAASPFGTSPAFSQGFFQGQRFGTPVPFGAGAFGTAGTPGFFPGGNGFPTGNGFGDGRMPPTGNGFPASPDGNGLNEQQGGSSMDNTGGMSGTDQGVSTNQNDLNTVGGSQTFQGSNNIFPDFNTPRPEVGAGAGQFPTGSGEFSTGAGQFPTGAEQFSTGFGQFPTGAGQFPTGTGQFSTGSGQFPTGSGQFPSGARQFPTGTGQFPTGAGQFPTNAGQFPTGTGFPTEAGQFPTGAGQFPTGTGQFPTGAGQFPTGTGQFSSRTGQFPAGAGQFPTGAGQFPTGSGQFPTGAGQFPTGFGRFTRGQFPVGPEQFPSRSGMMAGAMSGFNPMFPTTPGFGSGFRQPGMAGGAQGERPGTFPGDMPTGAQGDRGSQVRDPRESPNGQFQSGQAGFGQEFGRSDQSGASFSQRQRDMVPDPRLGGPSPFGATPSFQGMQPFGAQFPQRDPRFSGFGQTGRFAAGLGPEFNARPSPMAGSSAASAEPNPFPIDQDMGSPNFNDFNNNNNNQIISTGNRAAPIDGFGAVSSSNNLNTNSIASMNDNPADFIRLDEAATGSQQDVVVSESNAASAGSNEFRVVEVGNILDATAGAGRMPVSPSDQSVVDSMGFQAAENANIVSQDASEAVTVTDGKTNEPSTGTLNLPSPLNQDFSFFVPADNTAQASEPQGATFTVPAPPPPPPIMVANSNNQQPGTETLIAETSEMLNSLELFGFVKQDPSEIDSLMFPAEGTGNKRNIDPNVDTGSDVPIPEVVMTTTSDQTHKVEEKSTSSTESMPMEVPTNLI